MSELGEDLVGPSVDHEHFDSYKERFKQFFTLKRENGVIEARMHLRDDDSGVALWNYGVHNGWGKLFKAIGQDPENEVLIVTGTGDKWIGPIDPETSKNAMAYTLAHPTAYARSMYQDWYVDGQDLLLNLIWDLKIPTIGVVNGPGAGHTEFALACDLCLCSDDATFVEPHFTAGSGFVPGDGQMMVFQKILGVRKANYLALTGKQLDAQKSLEWGLVNEVLPRGPLMERAWELGRMVASKDRIVRRLTREIMRKPWKQAIETEYDLGHQFSMECWSAGVADYEALRSATDAFSPEAVAKKEHSGDRA